MEGLGKKKSLSVFVSVRVQAYPRRIMRGSANGGSKSCIFGIPPGTGCDWFREPLVGGGKELT